MSQWACQFLRRNNNFNPLIDLFRIEWKKKRKKEIDDKQKYDIGIYAYRIFKYLSHLTVMTKALMDSKIEV